MSDAAAFKAALREEIDGYVRQQQLWRADIEWLRERFPRTYELLTNVETRQAQCPPLDGSRIVTLHSGTKVEVRSGKVAVTS